MKLDYLEALEEQVHADVMACIGCNDCLLACPLPESQNITISELNYAVFSDQIADPEAIEFLTRCTQCRQCVPACPADLRRADIVLYNKMKVEDVAPDRLIPLQAGEQIVDSEWNVDELTTHLVSLPIFHGVEPKIMRRAVLSVTLRRLAEDEVLVEEGDYHERLLVVLDGQLEQTSIDTDGDRTRILVLDPGQFHGYMAVMSNSREMHAISATETTTIVEFNKATMLRLMREAEIFGERMEGLYRDRALWTHARNSPLLAGIDEDAVEDLLGEAIFRQMQPGEALYQEGDPPGDLYLIRDGFLRVARRFGPTERVLQYFREGDVCGLNALLFGQPQTATVSANTKSEVIQVPAATVNALLERHPEIRVYLSKQMETVERIDLTKGPPKSTTESVLPLEGLLDDGVVQGTEVLLINTAICVNCNNCVDSCERRHGHSRLHRSGLQIEELLFPSACRHCEDPKCLLCSVNGIVRLPDGEIRIVADNCIGCGACAERCPYGNINMHFREQQEQGGRRRLLDFFTSHKDDDDSLHRADIKGKRMAVKCDLCAGYEDYACVNGCPVGAAMRVNPRDVFGGQDVVVGLETKKGAEK